MPSASRIALKYFAPGCWAFNCALLVIPNSAWLRRGPVWIAGRQPQRRRAFRSRRRIDLGIVGESRMRVVVEDLDARDLRQQPLIDRRGLRRDERPRLRAGARTPSRPTATSDGERGQPHRHFASGCGFGSGLRGSIASRIAA